MTVNIFAVPVFFVVFRECLETVIIVSVLLSFLKQSIGPENEPVLYKRLQRQVWFGVAAGLAICVCLGGVFIGTFYGLGRDRWAETEDIWEGVFALFASLIITVVGAALLRVSKLQAKWRVKLARAIEQGNHLSGRGKRLKHWSQKYAMFMLPFITVLREGIEAVVFIAGVGLGLPATSFPLPVVAGLAAGALVGYIIFRFGNSVGLQLFLIAATCLLYLVAAALFSRAIWYFEDNAWTRIAGSGASEVGSRAGSYDIRKSVWHVNCCNPRFNGGGGWGIFSAILGWQNSATYGSVIGYNVYWLAVIIGFLAMISRERGSHWPCLPFNSAKNVSNSESRPTHAEETESGSSPSAAMPPLSLQSAL